MPPIPAEVPARRFHDDRLHHLVVRIAAGDRSAFRTFYALLAAPVWRDAIRMLPPADARAATRSTFVEIWHLAGYHLDRPDGEIRTWVLAVTAGHIDDRMRSADSQVAHRSSYDQHIHGELVALLGIGPPTICATVSCRVSAGHDQCGADRIGENGSGNHELQLFQMIGGPSAAAVTPRTPSVLPKRAPVLAGSQKTSTYQRVRVLGVNKD